MDLKTQGIQLQSLLGLRFPPVALAFQLEPPPNVSRISDSAPAGCGYWRVAAEGQAFFTEASDHYNCPIGAHTHGVNLPADATRELTTLIEAMARIEYIDMEEVATIPQRRQPFRVAVYAPLASTPVDPDVVLVRGNPKQMMLLAESVRAAGISQDTAATLRPTCAIVPEAGEAGRPSLSLGCIGNRVYSKLGDEEMYFAIPGPQMAAVVEKLETIINANRDLEGFHRGRQALT
jgi:uncharacterized protein (DUF169 family)